MRTIQEWLDEYAISHQNSTNKTIHWICVPSIMLIINWKVLEISQKIALFGCKEFCL